MSLKKTIAAHDDAALEGLTSKGVLRRAQRDIGKGNGEVVAVDSKQAEIATDGQTVSIDARGPAAATCTCPAAGICRHIVLAVLLLREPEDEPGQDAPSALEELCGLTDAQLQKFAGTDWEKAVTISASDEATEVAESGHSLVVSFPELEASVTFIAGQGMRQAAYKGPRTRQRLLTTVAVISVRKREGVVSAEAEAVEEGTRPAISAGFIDDAQLVIKQAVAAVIPGRSEIAYDMLLDLAISTRAEALPRLSAEVRGLANLAKLAQSRDVRFEADEYLRRASRSFALCEGLRGDGRDLALTGTIKRDYRPRDAMTLWLLGAAKWRSVAGARGVTCYGYSPAEKSWFSVRDGRAAGTDPSFSPDSVYFNALWGGGSMKDLIGCHVNLPGPSAAADGSLSLHSFSQPAREGPAIPTRTLLESDAAFDDWNVLRASLVDSLGGGLRRRVSPVPVVVVPRKFLGFGFNDLEQTYELEIADAAGDAIILNVEGDEHEVARYLKQTSRKVRALLVEVWLGANGWHYRPITAFQDERKSLHCVNLDFDHLSIDLRQKAMDRIGDFLKGSREPAARAIDPLATIASDVLEALVGKIGHSAMVDLEQLRSRAEAAGFVALAAALSRLYGSGNVEDALKAAYVATEIETMLLAAT